MAAGRHLRVRLLQAVTYGDLPAWQPGDVRLVPESIAVLLLSEGEAELVDSVGLDTSVAVGAVVMRVR